MGFGFEIFLNALMFLYNDPVLFAYYFKIPGELKSAEQPFQIVIGQDAGYRPAGPIFARQSLPYAYHQQGRTTST